MSRVFDAVDDVILFAHSDTFLRESDPLTIAAWINYRSVGEGGLGSIVTRMVAGASGIDFSMTGTNTLNFIVIGTTSLTVKASNSIISPGVWAYIAVTWDGSTTATNVKIYVNALETTYATLTNGVAIADNATSLIRIGNRNNTARTFDGSISHVQIFNRVLSREEIRRLMFLPGSIRDGLVIYCPLYGGDPEPDLSGNGYNGTVTGALVGSDPPIGRGARLARRNLITKSPQNQFAYTKDLSQSITISNSISKDTLKVISQTCTITEAQAKDILKAISQGFSLTESQAKNLLKVISQSLAISNNLDTNLMGPTGVLYTFLLHGNIEAYDIQDMKNDQKIIDEFNIHT